jgi:hypothetical protein
MYDATTRSVMSSLSSSMPSRTRRERHRHEEMAATDGVDAGVDHWPWGLPAGQVQED